MTVMTEEEIENLKASIKIMDGLSFYAKQPDATKPIGLMAIIALLGRYVFELEDKVERLEFNIKLKDQGYELDD